jgi:hypothetical protein
MPFAGFEPAIPGIEQLQTNASDRTAIWIGIATFGEKLFI